MPAPSPAPGARRALEKGPSSLVTPGARSYVPAHVWEHDMSAPLIVAVDDDPALLRDVERELRNRYQSDYRVCCLDSPGEALGTLEELAATGEQVALVLAGEQLAGAPGTDLLAEVRNVFTHA